MLLILALVRNTYVKAMGVTKGACPPLNVRISSHFVLREELSACCSPKIKISGPPNFSPKKFWAGYATASKKVQVWNFRAVFDKTQSLDDVHINVEIYSRSAVASGSAASCQSTTETEVQSQSESLPVKQRRCPFRRQTTCALRLSVLRI